MKVYDSSHSNDNKKKKEKNVIRKILNEPTYARKISGKSEIRESVV